MAKEVAAEQKKTSEEEQVQLQLLRRCLETSLGKAGEP